MRSSARTFGERLCERTAVHLAVDVSEDDLRAIAKRGYEGAVTTDLDRQAQAVGLFLSDTLLQI